MAKDKNELRWLSKINHSALIGAMDSLSEYHHLYPDRSITIKISVDKNQEADAAHSELEVSNSMLDVIYEGRQRGKSD